ncbi:hypothetical protein HYW99_01750 [Candidatus Woesearchaeota archaeon]|nr:hypothetical protein [Candidatus Woesearchaeota archaeon]
MSFEGTSLPPPPKKQEGVLKFGHGQHEDTNTASISNDVNILSRRLRLLEEGFTNLRRYFQMAEESMLAKNKHYTAEIRTLTSDIMEVRKEIQEIRDKMFLVIKELQTVARKEDVKKV